jgi:hypothetical protein
MNNSQKIIFEKPDIEKHKIRMKTIQIGPIFIGIIVLGIFCLLGLYLFETFPRYIVLPIPPPDYYEGSRLGGDWESTTYSMKLEPIVPPIVSRVFVWRNETGGVYDKKHGISSWEDIISYFDRNLDSYGWTRSDAYTPCQFYLPEANFLPIGQEGYVWYREKNYSQKLDFHGGNFICLAVWSNPKLISYNVVIVSVSQSPLNVIASMSNLENLNNEMVKMKNP